MCVFIYVCVYVDIYALEKHIVYKHFQLWQHDQDIYLEDQNIVILARSYLAHITLYI